MHDTVPLRADTERTREHITACLRSFEASGQHPIAREVASRLGISDSTVRRHVAALVAEGVAQIQERPVQTIRHEIVLVPSASERAETRNATP